MRQLVRCLYAARINESAVACDRPVAASLGGHHCTFHQQLGLLHSSHLPPDLPQEDPALRHQKRKFAIIIIFAAGGGTPPGVVSFFR